MNEERRKQQILHILAAGIRKVMEEAHLDYGKLQEIRPVSYTHLDVYKRQLLHSSSVERLCWRVNRM